jgi:hypothetical protein
MSKLWYLYKVNHAFLYVVSYISHDFTFVSGGSLKSVKSMFQRSYSAGQETLASWKLNMNYKDHRAFLET